MIRLGLNPVNLGSSTAFQQAVLCILLIIGNIIFVSTFIVLIRIYYFRKKLAEIVRNSHAARKAVEDLEQQETTLKDSRNGLRYRKNGGRSGNSEGNQQRRGGIMAQKKPLNPMRRAHYHQSGFGFFPAPWETDAFQNFFDGLFTRVSSKLQPEQHQYISFKLNLDTRGRPYGLKEHERLELGGVE